MKSEQKNRQEYGDFKLLADILDAPSTDAARMRFRRKDPEALEGMKAIKSNREEFIRKYKEKERTEP